MEKGEEKKKTSGTIPGDSKSPQICTGLHKPRFGLALNKKERMSRKSKQDNLQKSKVQKEMKKRIFQLEKRRRR